MIRWRTEYHKVTDLREWNTNVKVTVLKNGIVIDVIEFHNIITNVGLNLMRDILGQVVTDGGIKYMGWGNDNTPAAVGDLTLGTEFGRKQMTDQTAGAVGVMVSTVYISPPEGNSQKIEEFGWFAGVTATATANRGVMGSRVLYSRQKTDLESIQVERTDTIS